MTGPIHTAWVHGWSTVDALEVKMSMHAPLPAQRRTKLTARLVETVSTDNDRLELRDGEVAGLELLVGRGGAKTFRLRYRRGSDRRKLAITLGRFDKDAPEVTNESQPGLSTRLTLKGARTLATLVLGQIGLGADPANGVRERKTAVTFRELADEWMERHAKPNKSARALDDDRSMLARHVLPEIGCQKAGEIAKRDIIRLLDAVSAKSDARGGRDGSRKMTHRPNRVFELVRAIFRWAIGRDLITIDPTHGLAPPIKKEKPRERELSLAEIRCLWTALDRTPMAKRTAKGMPRGSSVVGDGDIPMTRSTALTLKLALVTAQRIGEVACMAVSELDLDNAAPLWTIPGERSKNGQPNRVPLSPLALRLITEAQLIAPGSAWLFPNPNGDGPINAHAPTKALSRARSAIGIEDFRVHDLRRTAATRMAELGINPHTISMILNHVSARQGTITSKVYVQYSYDKEKREALGAWSARLEEIIGA